MTTTKLCDIAYVGGKNEGAGNIVSEFHCLTHDVYWLSESMYAPLLCYKAQKNKKNKKNRLSLLRKLRNLKRQRSQKDMAFLKKRMRY